MSRHLITLIIVIFPQYAVYAESTDIGDFASRFLDDANETFIKPNNIAALLLASGAGVILHNSDADRNLNDNFERHRAFNDTTDKTFDLIGNPAIQIGSAGIWYLFGHANADELNKQRAMTMLSALAITDTVTFGLKAIVNTERPNGDNHSFPSAHTASSFCAASVLDEYYGPKVGIPAYIAASLVGWRMMDSGDHWASDVLFGATLGFIVGHSAAGKHKQLEIAGFQVEPLLSLNVNSATGICLVKRF
ncbi:MAG: phosphatase PAP2 family protein [Sedimentisphaerales bacterium]|nr:phosphatase PAP2 family protein [Sedimentisphaerales bacterium]